MRARWLTLAVAVLTALTLTGAAPARATTPDWAAPGPYGTSAEVLPGHTLIYPKPLGPARHPVIIWGNGTFAIPAVYYGLLRHWASHGFIVAAANTPMAGSATEMRAGIDLLAARDADPKSPFHGKVDLSRIGASGHSQGGAGAINAAADPRVLTAAPLQPGGRDDVKLLHGPALFLSGEKDGLVPPAEVKARYDASGHIPALYAELRGAGHLVPLGDAGGYRGPTTAWMRALLMNDQQARRMFFGPDCGYCADPAFSSFLRNPLASGS